VLEVFSYGPFTLYGAIFHSLHLTKALPVSGSYNPSGKPLVWALPLSLAATDGIVCSLSFPHLTEMFHFRWCRARSAIGFTLRQPGIHPAGLPHSEIHGSKRMCRYPWLIAACRVLHRLLAPRHSSCALRSLINLLPPSGPFKDRSGKFVVL
jgi:hypothetical protein